MNLEKIIKYQAGWNYQKGRWNTYPNDMMGLDTKYVQLDTGTRIGLAMPTQVFCRDQELSWVSALEQDIRTEWEQYSCMWPHPFSFTVEFFDIKTKTYRSARIYSRQWVYCTGAINDPYYRDPDSGTRVAPYAVGTFIEDDEGNSYCIHYKEYYVDSSDYDSWVPQYDIYLAGGFARNTWDGSIAVYFSPIFAFCPKNRMYSIWGYIGYCERMGFEHGGPSSSYSDPYWSGWGIGSLEHPHYHNDVNYMSRCGELLVPYYGACPPYGVKLYDENQENNLCPADYAYFLKAPSGWCSSGYVWYGNAAGVLSPTEDTNVDIDI